VSWGVQLCWHALWCRSRADRPAENKNAPLDSVERNDLRPKGDYFLSEAAGALVEAVAGAAGLWAFINPTLTILSLSSWDILARSSLSSLPSLLASYFASISVMTVCCSGVNSFLGLAS